MAVQIVGVYKVRGTREPCYLIEVRFDSSPQADVWFRFTQEEAGQPRDNWQTPWDEQPIDAEKLTWVFFFHYLDVEKPFLTPDGPVSLPRVTKRPKYLREIRYESPD